jgi:hypothetical protein
LATPKVEVAGLDALARDFKKLAGPSGPMVKAMRGAGLQALEPLAAVTRSQLPQVSGRLAADVRVDTNRAGATLHMGSPSVRYAGWVEFGGRRKVPHESTREYDSRGRYLFPAAIQVASRSAGLYNDAVTETVRSFHWTNQTSEGESVHD